MSAQQQGGRDAHVGGGGGRGRELGGARRGLLGARLLGGVLVLVRGVEAGGARAALAPWCGRGRGRGCGCGELCGDEVAAGLCDDAGVAGPGVGGGVCECEEVGVEVGPGVGDVALAGLCVVAGLLCAVCAVFKVEEDACWGRGVVVVGVEGLEGGGDALCGLCAFADVGELAAEGLELSVGFSEQRSQ